MKNKKGFTLVELLAVIIVLAVVAVISIPVIGNLIDKAKKDMLRDSAINLVDSGKTYYANALMDNDEGLESSKKFTIGENINELDFKGRLPSSGYLEISTKGDISLAVVSGEYCAKKEFYDTEIIITDNLNECNVSGIDKAETVNDSCFVFNAKTRTITGYNFSKKDCDKPNIAIPATIGDIPVEHIAPGAFVQDSDGAIAMYYDPNSYEEFIDIYENASYYKEAFGYEMALVFPVRNIKQNFGKYCVSNNPGITMDDVRYDYEYLNESSITKVMSLTSSRDKCYAMPKGEASEDELIAFGTRLDSIDFSNATNLKSIGDYAFFATSLSSIKFGNNPTLDRIGNSAFIYNELQNLDLSGLSSLYEIDNSAFISNYLTTVKFPNNLTIIGDQAFANNYINSIDVPTMLEYIGDYAFTDNYIRRLDAENSNLETIGYGAFIDNIIEYITLPEGLTYIEPYAFENNYLGNLVIPSTLYRIGYSAFYNSGITSLTIKAGVSRIEERAFCYNYGLQSLILEEGLTYIGNKAFYDSNLYEVTIPTSVKEIGHSAFISNSVWENVTILYNDISDMFRFDSSWELIGWPYHLMPATSNFEYALSSTEVNSLEYIRGAYLLTVPVTGSYKVELWGAAGGGADPGKGGKGGFISSNINLTSGTQYLLVIGQGGSYVGGNYDSLYATQGGGGAGYGYGGSGGGATILAMYEEEKTLGELTIMAVAGGGGGASDNTGAGYSYLAGDGGYLYSDLGNLNGTNSSYGTGGTQTAGGIKTNGVTFGNAGGYLQGGTGVGDLSECNDFFSDCNSAGGGGGGYYGGAGGTADTDGGAGGSSYVNSSYGNLNEETVPASIPLKVCLGANLSGENGLARITYIG